MLTWLLEVRELDGATAKVVPECLRSGGYGVPNLWMSVTDSVTDVSYKTV